MQAILCLGGNLGNREAYLKFATYFIRRDIGKILKNSSMYETKALGGTATRDFLNQLLLIETSLSPEKLMEEALLIEKKAGRTRLIKWGNRTLDIDLIYYDNKIINTPSLKLPHPEMQNRLFVLIPLQEIAADFIHPILKKNTVQLCQECKDTSEVVLLKQYE